MGRRREKARGRVRKLLGRDELRRDDDEPKTASAPTSVLNLLVGDVDVGGSSEASEAASAAIFASIAALLALSPRSAAANSSSNAEFIVLVVVAVVEFSNVEGICGNR